MVGTRSASIAQPPSLAPHALFYDEQLECGEKHLAQDLFLSWPAVDRALGCSLPSLGQEKDPSTVTMSKTVDEKTHDEDGNSIAGGPSGPDPPVALFHGGGVASESPLLALPRHMFVFAEPFSGTKGIISSSVQEEDVIGVAGNSCPESKNGPPVACKGEAREHCQHHGQEQRQTRPGMALAFHSSFLPLARGGDQPGISLRQELPFESRLHAAAESVTGHSAAGVGSVGVFSSTFAVPANQPAAATEQAIRKEDGEHVAADKNGRNRLSYHPKGVHHGSLETSDDGDGGGQVLPRRFGYSLGKPFHSQRVASVKFITPGAPTARLESGRGGFSPGLRLITGE